MWESLPLLPRWLSPDWALFEWLFAIGMILLVSGSSARDRAPLFARALGGLVGAQGIVFAAALAVGYWVRRRGGNPNDVYVVGAALGALVWIVAIAFVVQTIPTGPAPEPLDAYKHARPGQCRLSHWELGLVIAGAVVTIVVCAVVLVYVAVIGFVLLIFSDAPWIVPPLVLATAFLVLAGAAIASWRRFPPSAWPHPRDARFFALWPVGTAVVVLGLKTFLFTTAPASMADGALVAEFSGLLHSSRRSGPMISELSARPRARWSGLEAAVRSFRKSYGKPDSPSVQLEKYWKNDVHHSETFMTVPGPYSGNPELGLVRVLCARGDLAEPRAWADDESLPAGARLAVMESLLPAERRIPGGRPERVVSAAGRLCAPPTLAGAHDCPHSLVRMLGAKGARGRGMQKPEAFAAAYATLRAADWHGADTNAAFGELLMAAPREVGRAVALAARAVARRDPERVVRWETWARADPVRCEALARLGEHLCPTLTELRCAPDSWDWGHAYDHSSRPILRCFAQSSEVLPPELAALANY